MKLKILLIVTPQGYRIQLTKPVYSWYEWKFWFRRDLAPEGWDVYYEGQEQFWLILNSDPSSRKVESAECKFKIDEEREKDWGKGLGKSRIPYISYKGFFLDSVQRKTFIPLVIR